MSDKDTEVKVKFGAETAALKDGLSGAAQAVQNALNSITNAFSGMASTVSRTTSEAAESAKKMADGMEGGFGKVTGVIGKFNVAMAAVGAVLAGGAAFKAAVGATQEFYGENMKLARALGISATQASVLNIALGDVYISAETFTNAASMLSRQVRTNEADLKKMGVETRNADGSLKEMDEMMMSAIKVLGQYKEGTDRTIAAQKLFGRGAQEAAQLVKVNANVIEEARKKAEDLGLTMTEQNVKAARAYKAAMNDAGDVMLALKKVIGDILMPILTKLAQWWSEVGPAAVVVMRVAIASLAAAFWTLKNAVVLTWEVINAMVNSVGAPIMALGRAISKAMSGDFIGAKQELTAIPGQIANAWIAAYKNIKASSLEAGNAIIEAFNPSKKAAEKTISGTKSASDLLKQPKDKTDKDQSRMGEWENELMGLKLKYEAENNLREMSKEQEIEYWKDIQTRHKLTREEQLAVDRKMLTLQLDINKEKFADEIAALRVSLEQYKNNMMQREAIAQQIYEKVKARYGAESKEAQAAAAEIGRIRKAAADQEKKAILDAANTFREQKLGEVDLEAQMAQQQQALGLITKAELLRLEQEFENQRYAIKQAALEERMQLLLQDPDANPEEIRKTLDSILEIRRQHELKLREIKQAAYLEDNKYSMSFLGGLQGQFESTVNSMLTTTKSFRATMAELFGGIYKSFVSEMITKPLAQWAMRYLRETALYKMLMGEQIASQGMASSATTGIKATEASAVVGSNAAEAASGAAASQAAIPIAGWALAGAAFAATMAMVLGARGQIRSARGGFDIPAGSNPMTQLHEKEMVLPAKYADTIRDMSEGGGGGGGVKDVHFNVSAMDGDSVRKFFNQHKIEIMRSIKEAARNGTQLNMKFRS